MAKNLKSQSFTHHLPKAERRAIGKALREECPRVSQATWKAEKNRPNPVETVLVGNKGRIAELVPLRHGRMSASPFTFYRGAAMNMAVDLATMPVSGIRVQACGDAHLSNFGGFATPERQVVFGINDLDETLPAPWEWDVKRLAASIVIASRNNGLSDKDGADASMACVRMYREKMAEYATMSALERWYLMMESETMLAQIDDPAIRKRIIKRIEKARQSSAIDEVFPKIAETKGDLLTIKDSLPTMFHWKGHSPGTVHEAVQEAFDHYRSSLEPAYRVLLDRYELKDAAIKVVGVGSVGTACWVLLLMSGDGSPFFLQVKEARTSVLAPFAGKSHYANQGERIVHGYRLMQPASDIFLGWTQGRAGRHFYVRQLRDVKIKALVETFGTKEMTMYAQWCGQALALSHARCGDPSVISGYLGKSDTFDKAMAAFSLSYADQNEKDHAEFVKAIKSGKVKAEYDAPGK